MPLLCGADCVIVEFDDVEEAEELEAIEETEDEEFVRWALFRGMNIRATSSACIVFTLEPHAVRLFCWKLGGLATAVIGEVYFGLFHWYWDGSQCIRACLLGNVAEF